MISSWVDYRRRRTASCPVCTTPVISAMIHYDVKNSDVRIRTHDQWIRKRVYYPIRYGDPISVAAILESSGCILCITLFARIHTHNQYMFVFIERGAGAPTSFLFSIFSYVSTELHRESRFRLNDVLWSRRPCARSTHLPNTRYVPIFCIQLRNTMVKQISSSHEYRTMMSGVFGNPSWWELPSWMSVNLAKSTSRMC
jgi:hypothetical protein